MLKETKLALRVSASAYDAEIADLIRAGAKDLQLAGINIHGFVAFSTVTSESGTAINDGCRIDDALVRRAIITYVQTRFGNPTNYDRLKAAYDEMKAQLMSGEGYTDWGDGECEEQM